MSSNRYRAACAAVVLTLATTACASAQNARPGASTAASAEQEVRKLDAGWANAYAVHDTAFALSLMAPDISITSTDGTMKTRAQELNDIRASPDLRMEYFRTSDVSVRVLDGAAVVTGLASWKFTYQGRESTVARRYTSVYARGGPLGWRMVAIQLGRAPATP